MSTESTIDLEDIKKIANRACDEDENVQVVDYHLEPYSKNKVGFLGTHQKLEITVKRSKSSDKPVKLSFFVKSLPRDSPEQASFIKQQCVYEQEAEFFNKVMSHLLEVTSVGDIEPWAPKCYLATSSFIVLEDVRTKGYTMHDSSILEGETLKAALRTMARLHAASLLAEKKLGKPLNKLYPRACVDHLFDEQNRKYGTDLPTNLIIDVAKKQGRTAKDVNEVVHQIYEYMCHEKSEHRVICHGDAWPNNTMLTSDKPPKCLLVDYQMVRYAPRMIDVAQLIYLSTNREVRQKEEDTAIKAYWNELCETLRKCDPSIERPSLEDLQKEYEENRLAALFIAVIYYPTILLSKEVFTEYKDDPVTLYRKFIFRSNNDCVLKLMEKDEVYGKRITETVIEFVENCE